MKKIKEYFFQSFSIYDFYDLSIIKRLHPPFFKETINTASDLSINFEQNPNSYNTAKGLYYVTYIPPYVKTIKDENLKYLPLKQFIGFLINIKSYDSLESYMEFRFSSKSRRKIKTYSNRLNTCFNTSYHLYYGSIDKEVYYQLMGVLKTMIKTRFNQRGETHQEEKQWNYYRDNTYQDILDKKASLYVIYDNDKPITICLSYHRDTVFIANIIGFDIDYERFGLGYVGILKQLEWSFENNYAIFDLGSGVLSYKQRLSDTVYKFQNNIIFYKKSFKNICFGYFIFFLLRFKLFLTEKNILMDKANSSKDISDDRTDTKSEKLVYEIKESDLKKEIPDHLIKIDIEQEAYKFLRKTIYEYLYLNFEYKNNISIYKNEKKQDSYFIMGKKNMELTLKKTDGFDT